MTKISAVYKIVNTVTGDCYVGSSRNVKNRWWAHRSPSNWMNNLNNPMYQDMQKYGIDKFRFQILCPVEPEHLKEVEQELIEMVHPTYNDRRSNGWDVERRNESRKKYLKKYRQSEKGKEVQKRYSQTEKGKESRKRRYEKYYSQMCSYNGEMLTLDALRCRFRKAGIEHPTLEAKKYLIQ